MVANASPPLQMQGELQRIGSFVEGAFHEDWGILGYI